MNNFYNFNPDIVVLGHADNLSQETIYTMKKAKPNCTMVFRSCYIHGPDYKNNKKNIRKKIAIYR